MNRDPFARDFEFLEPIEDRYDFRSLLSYEERQREENYQRDLTGWVACFVCLKPRNIDLEPECCTDADHESLQRWLERVS